MASKFVRLAIIHFEANEAEIFEDVIKGTQETISHTGIFDSIKNAFFLVPLMHIQPTSAPFGHTNKQTDKQTDKQTEKQTLFVSAL